MQARPGCLFKYAQIFVKGRLQIKQRLNLHAFAIPIKTFVLNMAGRVVIYPLRKIKGRKKIVVYSNRIVNRGMPAMAFKPNLIYPGMHLGV